MVQGQTVYISHSTVSLYSTTPGAVIYYTLDGSVPAYEAPGERVIEGMVYNGPFEVIESLTVTAAAVKPGMRIGLNNTVVTLKVARPIITPPSNPGQKLPSPVTVALSSATPGALLFYSLQPNPALLPYSSTFLVAATGNVTAIARKEGLLDSDVASISYSLFVNAPVITPSGSSIIIDSANVTMRTSTQSAGILYTICPTSQALVLSNRSKGETIMTPADKCFPDCSGICRGGTNPGAACKVPDILDTCRGDNGECMSEYHMVKLCDPIEWPRGASIYTSQFEMNATSYGSNSVITAVAVQSGLDRSQTVRATLRIQASLPTLFASGSGELTGPIAPKEGDIGPLRGPIFVNFSHPIDGATILYTLDGTQPSTLNTRSTRVYVVGSSNQVIINVTTRILAIATAGLLEPSSTLSSTVQVQLGVPVLTAIPYDVIEPEELISRALNPPFIYPQEGARTASATFWRDDLKSLYINVSAKITNSMPSAMVLYQVVPGAQKWSKTVGVYYDDSAATSTMAQLLATGWRRFMPENTISILSNVTIKTVAVLPGARTSAVAYTPGMRSTMYSCVPVCLCMCVRVYMHVCMCV